MSAPGGSAPGGCLLWGETATAADGTHPTGMHSCYVIISLSDIDK